MPSVEQLEGRSDRKPDPAAAAVVTKDVATPILDIIEAIHAPTAKALRALVKLGGVQVVNSLIFRPLLLAFLAAFWLLLLARLDVWPINAARAWYIGVIRDGFSIDAAAKDESTRQNKLIDYTQVVDIVLSREKPKVGIPFNIQAGRRMQVAFHADNPGGPCLAAMSQGQPLAFEFYVKTPSASIGKLLLSDADATSNDLSRELDNQWWKDNYKSIRDPQSDSDFIHSKLFVRRSDASSAQNDCPILTGQLELSVYKTQVYP